MTFGLTLVFMILVFWRPQEWLIPELYGWNLLDAVVYPALLSLLIEIQRGRIRCPPAWPYLGLLAGLWVAAILSHVVHTYFAGVLWTVPDFFKLCLFTTLLLSVLDRPQRLWWVAVIFVGMSAVMAVHALLQATRGYGFADAPPLFIPERADRPAHTRSLFFGIFGDPNDLAQILATALPFTFALPRRASVGQWLMAGVLAALLLVGAWTTHSRGGYLALLTVAAILVLLLFPRRWFPTVAVAGGILVLALCPYVAGHLDESARDRVDFWGQANWTLKENPVFGIGYALFPDFISGSRAAHNAFVLCYTELGLFGYWFWYGLVQLSVLGAWRTRMAIHRPRNAEENWLKRFAGLSLAAMGSFCVSSYFLTRAFVYPLFFLIGTLGALPTVWRASQPEDTPPLITWTRDVCLYGTVGMLCSIAYIYGSIRLLNLGFLRE